MSQLFNYSWDESTTLLNGVELSNHDAGDDVFQAARRSDSMSDTMGADGDMATSKQTDKSGSITIRLLQGSPSNNYVRSLLNVQETGLFVPITLQHTNNLSGEVVSGVQGYIKRHSDVSRGVNQNAQTWEFVFTRLDFV